MKSISIALALGLFSASLTLPARASLDDLQRPGCGDEDKKKDDDKNPASVTPGCGDEDKKKDDDKNPA